MVAMLIPTGPGASGPGTFLPGQYRNAWDFVAQDLRRLQRLAGNALVNEANQLRQELVAETSRGLGPRVGRSWLRPKQYRGPPPVIRAAVISSRAPNIIFAHDQPSLRIRPSPSSRLAARGLTPRSTHRMLAIPTPRAGPRGQGRFSNQPMTPAVYEQVHNVRLVKVGNTLIDPELRDGGKGRRKAKGGRGSVADAVVFILVPQVTLRKRVDTEAPGREATLRLLQDIEGEFTRGGVP